jgi:hypothetical protein
MQQNEFERFRDIMRGMGRMYSFDVDAVVLDAYWMALQYLQFDEFEMMASYLMGNSKFMPRPVDFKEIRKSSEHTAGEAWEIALKNCTCWRTGNSPGGRIDRAAGAVGGYRTIAMADTETSLPHIERRFKEAYEELSDVEESREALQEIEMRALSNAVQRNKLDDALQDVLHHDKGSKPRDGSNGFVKIGKDLT